jgi:hypothetical protein
MKPANGMYGGRINQKREDPTRCVEAIWDDVGRGHYQCRNKRKEGPGLEYCGVHNPDKIAAREEARRKAYEAAREQRWDVVLRREHKQMDELLCAIIESYDWCKVDPVDRGWSRLDDEITRARKIMDAKVKS